MQAWASARRRASDASTRSRRSRRIQPTTMTMTRSGQAPTFSSARTVAKMKPMGRWPMGEPQTLPYHGDLILALDDAPLTQASCLPVLSLNIFLELRRSGTTSSSVRQLAAERTTSTSLGAFAAGSSRSICLVCWQWFCSHSGVQQVLLSSHSIIARARFKNE